MPSPLKPGDVLAGRYRIERVLGEGGMGVVARFQRERAPLHAFKASTWQA